MSNRLLILFMLAGLLVSKQSTAQWCRSAGDFDGLVPFQSFIPTAGSITLRWAGQAEYSNERYTIYKKKSLSDPWELVASNLYGNSYQVQGLSSNTTYNFKIERWCTSGAFIDLIPGIPAITTKDAAYVLPNQAYCFGSIFGITSYSPSSSAITVYWSGDVFQGSLYKVFTRINDRVYGTANVWGVSNLTSSTGYTLTGLNPSTTYEFYVEKYCNNQLVGNSGYRKFATLAGGTNGSTFLGPVATITSATYNSASLTFWNHLFAFPGTRLDGFTVYVYSQATGWVPKATIPAVANVTTQYNYVIPGLAPSTKYDCIVAQNYTLNPGQSFESHHSVFSNTYVFKTAPQPIGPCGGIAGNFNAPAINNTGGVNFYEGIITSAAPVTLSTVQRRFTASGVLFNPGFTTTVSGNGNFIANAFNPANCAQSRMAGGAETGEVLPSDAIVKGIQPDLVLNERVLQSQNGFAIYPNPTAGVFTILTDGPGETIKQVVITDALGKQVFTNRSGNRRVNISHLANGLYLYKVYTSAKTVTGKLIKQ
jgi:Secretion system C-terminal sorting domain